MQAIMSYVGPADGQSSVTFTHVGSLPDAIAPNLFAYYRRVYGNYVDANGNLTTSPTNTVATDAQIFDAFSQGVANAVADAVTRYMQESAAEAARAQVSTVTVTKLS